MRSLYALLVGINDYEAPVRALSGCINDIEAAELVLGNLCGASGLQFRPSVFKNSEATRDAVISGFRSHLARADGDDVALFYYAGHGSQQATPEEFWHLEPDGLNETLVLFDSRREGKWDLADKELAFLLTEVAANAAHLICILDCCHSGSATRAGDGLSVRTAPIDERSRPADAFLGARRANGPRPRTRGNSADWSFLPEGRHVLLAACRPEETAKEILEEGKSRGAFSAALIRALQESDGRISYRDLMKKANAQVRQRVAEQTPQLELNDGGEAERLFFGDPREEHVSYFTLRFDVKHGWVIDGGAIHGFVSPEGDEVTSLAIFPLGGSLEERRRLDGVLAFAVVDAVRPEESLVRFKSGLERLDNKTIYRAIVVGAPLSPVMIHLSGKAPMISAIRRKLGSIAPGSTLLRETDNRAGASFRAEVSKGSLRVSRAGGTPPPVSFAAEAFEGVGNIIERFEHMAKWHVTAMLHNSLTLLPEDTVTLGLLVLDARDGKGKWTRLASRKRRLSYVQGRDGWRAPQLKILITNNSPSDIHVALLWLGEDWSISSSLLGGTAHKLPPGASISALQGRAIEAKIPDDIWRLGITELNDRLKVIASTEQFDPSLFDQTAIDDGAKTRAVPKPPRTTFERLSGRALYRDLGPAPSVNEAIADWMTVDLTLTVTRPLKAERSVSKRTSNAT